MEEKVVRKKRWRRAKKSWMVKKEGRQKGGKGRKGVGRRNER